MSEFVDRFTPESARGIARRLKEIGKGKDIEQYRDALRGVEFPPEVDAEATAYFAKIRNDISGDLKRAEQSYQIIRENNPALATIIDKGIDLGEILSSDANERDKQLAVVGTLAAVSATIPVVGTVASIAIGIIGTAAVFLAPLFKPREIPALSEEEKLALQWTQWTTGNRYFEHKWRGFRGYFEHKAEYERPEFQDWYEYVKNNTNDVLVYIPSYTGDGHTIFLKGISRERNVWTSAIEARAKEGEGALKSNYFNRFRDYEKFINELVIAPDSLKLRIDASAALTRRPISFEGLNSTKEIENSFIDVDRSVVENALKLIRYGVFDMQHLNEPYYGLKTIIKQAARHNRGLYSADGRYYPNPSYFGLNENERTRLYVENASQFARQVNVMTSETTIQMIRAAVVFKSQNDLIDGQNGLPVDLTTGDFLANFPNVQTLERTMKFIEQTYNVKFDRTRALTSLNREPQPPRIIRDADGRYEDIVLPPSSGVDNAAITPVEKRSDVLIALAAVGLIALNA